MLRAWVAAAGGWSDAAAVYLPVSLPRRLALGMINAHARMLGLAVRDDPDDPALTAWLRGSTASLIDEAAAETTLAPNTGEPRD